MVPGVGVTDDRGVAACFPGHRQAVSRVVTGRGAAG